MAHIHGGEVTSNAFDESFRHSITLMSQIHFVAAKKYFKKSNAIGKKSKKYLFSWITWSIQHKNLKYESKKNLSKKFSIKFSKYNFFLIYHPETLEKNYGIQGFENLISVLKDFNDVSIFTIFSNSDTGYLKINKTLQKLQKDERFYNFKSLDHKSYLSLLKNCDLIVGNSSSGIIEAPSLDVVTINIETDSMGE